MPTSTTSTGPIMDVWQNNLDIEMAKIRSVVQQYPYIAMVQFVSFMTALSLSDVFISCCMTVCTTISDKFPNV